MDGDMNLDEIVRHYIAIEVDLRQKLSQAEKEIEKWRAATPSDNMTVVLSHEEHEALKAKLTHLEKENDRFRIAHKTSDAPACRICHDECEALDAKLTALEEELATTNASHSALRGEMEALRNIADYAETVTCKAMEAESIATALGVDALGRYKLDWFFKRVQDLADAIEASAYILRARTERKSGDKPLSGGGGINEYK